MLKEPVIFDGRNLWEPRRHARAAASRTIPIGRSWPWPAEAWADGRRQMARVLVTGGAGFIGSHLCERFLADGHEVICVDNLLTGDRDNIAHLFANPQFTFLAAGHHQLHLRDGTARRDPALRVAGQPGRLPRAADPDPQGRLARHAQGARPRAREEARASWWPRPRRCTAIRWSIRSARTTGATSTRSARAASTTKPSASSRR